MALGRTFEKLARDGSLGLIARLLRETGREFAGRYALVVVLSLVIAGTTAFNAWLIKDIINQVFFDRRADMLWFLTAVIVWLRARLQLLRFRRHLGRIGNASWRIQAGCSTMLNLGVETSAPSATGHPHVTVRPPPGRCSHDHRAGAVSCRWSSWSS